MEYMKQKCDCCPFKAKNKHRLMWAGTRIMVIEKQNQTGVPQYCHRHTDKLCAGAKEFMEVTEVGSSPSLEN